MSAQLALNLRLRDSASFDNFHAARNAQAVACLRSALTSLADGKSRERMIFLAGATGSGRTHLLQAACRDVQLHRFPYLYVPLTEVATAAPSVLNDHEPPKLVCIDDFNVVVGKSAWEQAVFALIEQLQVVDGLLIVAAAAVPAQLGIGLPDLVTRLGAGPVFTLMPLSDDERLLALQLRAHRLGLELPGDVARYVLARHPRDLHSLFGWLDRVDRQSLAAQRKLTIPFVKRMDSETGIS